jgi:hypothetical protein
MGREGDGVAWRWGWRTTGGKSEENKNRQKTKKGSVKARGHELHQTARILKVEKIRTRKGIN